jgi:predicted transcriptional regulator
MAGYDAGIVDNGRVTEISKLLGPLGAEVMDVLWRADGPLPVREVLDRLNRGRSEPLAYTTVMTVLTRLAERGAATRTAVGRGYVYQPAVKDAADLAVRDVVRDHGEAAVAYFVDQARADPVLLDRLRRLIGPEPGAEP